MREVGFLGCYRPSQLSWAAAAAMAIFASRVVAAEEPVRSPAEPLKRVEITGAAQDDRRSSPVAKLNVTSDDLTRYGDTTLAEALQRVPGITVSRTGGKDFEIRLRGLGSGYTQILLNGEPVAPGFSIESISPEVVDHVEVYRSSTADMSSQAIAGTVNIVLKRAKTKQSRSIKAGVAGRDALISPNASLDLNETNGALAYGLSVSASDVRDYWLLMDRNVATDAASAPLYEWISRADNYDRRTTISLLPQFSWKLADNDSISVTAFVLAQRIRNVASEYRNTLFGQTPEFAVDTLGNSAHVGQQRLTLDWKTPVGGNGRLESKLTGISERRSSLAILDGSDDLGELALHRSVNSVLKGRSVSAIGKYSLDLGEAHGLGVGWDAQIERRSEDRIQRETRPAGVPAYNLDEDYVARINRIALYVQDVWQATEQLSLYLGIRGESLHTRTNGADLPGINVDNRVLSPSLQALWKIPGTKADQVRISLNRTYKPPTARDLIPRRWVETQNGSTRPNFQGNPSLRPELSWGAEMSYERYMGQDGFVGLNFYSRRISDVVIRRVYKEDDVWIATPTNQGSADVLGIEVEGKGKLIALWASAPDVSLRGGFTRNWSSIAAIPGPGNRLARQPKTIVNLGADWRPSKSSWSFGGDLLLEDLGFFKSTLSDTTDKGSKAVLNMYALWEVGKQTRFRCTASNILRRNEKTIRSHFDGAISEYQYTTEPTYATIKAQLEMKF